MNILALDFETTSDDPKKCLVTEIGAAMLNVEKDHNGRDVFTIKDTYSTFVYHPDYPPLDPFISDITGITDEMLKEKAILPTAAFERLILLVKSADIIMAHNVAFDRTVFESTCESLKMLYPRRDWICTYQDIEYPKKYTCKKLSHLALDHGMRMDGRKFHRAIDDVRLMVDLVTLHYDIGKIIEYSKEPWIYLKADIPAPWTDGGKGKEAAHKLGYSWEKCRNDTKLFPKTWVKRVKACNVGNEHTLASFKVIELGE